MQSARRIFRPWYVIAGQTPGKQNSRNGQATAVLFGQLKETECIGLALRFENYDLYAPLVEFKDVFCSGNRIFTGGTVHALGDHFYGKRSPGKRADRVARGFGQSVPLVSWVSLRDETRDGIGKNCCAEKCVALRYHACVPRRVPWTDVSEILRIAGEGAWTPVIQ